MLLSWILLIAFCSLGASGRQGQCQIQRPGQRQGRCFSMRITRKRNDCKCGLAKRTTKGTGVHETEVQETEVHEYPWQVAMAVPAMGANLPLCGGVLISNKWVLTSASCQHGFSEKFIKKHGRIWLGEHDWSTEAESRRLERTIERLEIHPNFKKGGFSKYDLALIKLSSPVNFAENSYIRPICLPEETGQDYADFTSVTTGWGPYYIPSTLTLQEQTVQVLSVSACRDILERRDKTLKPYHLCAKKKDECIIGDIGGPLITAGEGDGVTPGQNYELIGVSSMLSTDCSFNIPGIYTRVTEFLDWIRDKTGELDTCPRE